MRIVELAQVVWDCRIVDSDLTGLHIQGRLSQATSIDQNFGCLGVSLLDQDLQRNATRDRGNLQSGVCSGSTNGLCRAGKDRFLGTMMDG